MVTMQRITTVFLGAACVLTLALPTGVHAETPGDTVADAPPSKARRSIVNRKPIQPYVFSVDKSAEGESDFFFTLRPEYRFRMIAIDPLDLNGEEITYTAWGEQRLRVDLSAGKRGVGAIFVQADFLDGALFGDNGSFGGSPAPTSGASVASRQANESTWVMGLLPGERDGLSTDDYGPVLAALRPMQLNFAYGEVLLPFGLLRLGRQPNADGMAISFNDGRSHRNWWGTSWYHQSVDRILFGTSLSEAFNMLTKDDHVPSLDRNHGVFIGAVYDYLIEDDIYRTDDDLRGFAVQLDWRMRPGSLGDDSGGFRLTGTFNYRWDEQFNTRIYALPLMANFSYGDFGFQGQFSYISGHTQELSAGFGALIGSPIYDQDLSMVTARAIADYQVGPMTFMLEWGYSSD